MNNHPETLTWKATGQIPALKPGALHLWKIVCGTSGASLDGLWPVLSPSERSRAKRLQLATHRARFVRAHAGLRHILSNYLKIPPQHIVFRKGYAGKPALANSAERLEFNLTTSDDLAMVAVCLELPVGIDCEVVRPRRGLDAIAQRMFPPEVAARIASSPEAQRLETFALAWTALEAQVKADGRGLFRRRDEPPMPVLEVSHCVPHQGFIAAVARADLPPIEQWRTFRLD